MEESKKITHKNLGQTQIFKKREEVDEEVNSDGNTYKTKKINAMDLQVLQINLQHLKYFFPQIIQHLQPNIQ